MANGAVKKVGRVAGAEQIELGGDPVVEPPRDHRRVQVALVLLGRPQNAGTPWRPRPLVQVGDVPIDPEGIDVDRDVARHVRAVGQYQYAPLVAQRGDLGERQYECSCRCDVIDDEQPSAIAEPAGDGRDEVGTCGTGLRKFDRA